MTIASKIDIILPGFPGTTNSGFLGLSTVVLIRGTNNILFDTGGFGRRAFLRERLLQRGLSLDDIDAVIFSHLHFDHSQNALLFKKARYYVHMHELQYALNIPDDTLYPEGIADALKSTGRLRVVEKDGEFLPEVFAMHSPGHSPGSMSISTVSEGKRLILTGDAVKNLAELITCNAEMSMDDDASRRSIRAVSDKCDCIIPGHDSPLDPKRGCRLHPAELQLVLSRGVLSEGRAQIPVQVS